MAEVRRWTEKPLEEVMVMELTCYGRSDEKWSKWVPLHMVDNFWESKDDKKLSLWSRFSHSVIVMNTVIIYLFMAKSP
jgi:hypothetical protein